MKVKPFSDAFWRQ